MKVTPEMIKVIAQTLCCEEQCTASDQAGTKCVAMNNAFCLRRAEKAARAMLDVIAKAEEARKP